MKQIDLWGKIAEDKNYGEAWRGRGIAGEELENLIASEVHARLVGERGKEILNQIAQEKGKANIVEKLKAWALEFWKNLKSAFSNWSEDDLRYLTIDDFNHMTVRDFAEGVNLNKIVAEVVKGHQGREINGEALDVTELVGSQSEGSESGDRDNDDSTPTEAPDGAEAAEDTRQAPEYDELAKWQQAVMKKKGYDEELFDTMDGESQDQKIECLHV